MDNDDQTYEHIYHINNNVLYEFFEMIYIHNNKEVNILLG